MKQQGIENAAQLTTTVNNYWLAGEVERLGVLPKSTQFITRQAIGNYLEGRSKMTSANLELILEALGICNL